MDRSDEGGRKDEGIHPEIHNERIGDEDLTEAQEDSEFSNEDESIADDAPLTEAQRLEAERRLKEYEANPERYSTWEEVKRRLESK